MNAILTVAAIAVCIAVILLAPGYGASAVLLCVALGSLVGLLISSCGQDRVFLGQIFVMGLLLRMMVATAIFALKLHSFFGPDALGYDDAGNTLLKIWHGELYLKSSLALPDLSVGWGMLYLVASVYQVTGRNMLAVQFLNGVLGASTAVIIFMCARHIFENSRVAKVAGVCVAFYPSLILWSSMELKDSPTIFLLALTMLATLKLGEKLTIKYAIIIMLALFGIMSLRFYIFYMLAAAMGGAFVIGTRTLTGRSLLRQFTVMIALGLTLTYLGVTRAANANLETYGNLQAVQRSRLDLSQSAQSGFGKDVDVSTTAGAISAIPIGMIYLLFAPFPWDIENLRQSITLPEMLVWWASFPLLVLGLWFTIRYRLRQALPILIFVTMLTFAYSIFQGNVGTAYRQRAQLLVFYFIFVAVGAVLIKERAEDSRKRTAPLSQSPLMYRSGSRV